MTTGTVQCEYKATQKYSLIKLHVDSKHVGEKYGCNECDFKEGYKFYPARARSARARRALGLLLADGAHTVGRGKTF